MLVVFSTIGRTSVLRLVIYPMLNHHTVGTTNMASCNFIITGSSGGMLPFPVMKLPINRFYARLFVLTYY